MHRGHEWFVLVVARVQVAKLRGLKFLT
jgi:hypothetical protein